MTNSRSEARDAGAAPTLLRHLVYGSSADATESVDGTDVFGPPDPAEDFHEASKITVVSAAGLAGPAADYFVTVPDAHRLIGRAALTRRGLPWPLPAPHRLPVDLADVVARRRSELCAEPAGLELAELTQLLAMACGPMSLLRRLTGAPPEPDDGRRAAPSGGALFPLDTVAVCSQVDGVEPGTYAYDAPSHALHELPGVTPDEFHRRASLTAGSPTPDLTVALVATFARTRAKYGLRGYRFALLEAGHIAHGLVLIATALGLTSLPWGGYVDTEVDAALELDGVDRSCVYLVSVSSAAGAGASPRSAAAVGSNPGLRR